MSNPTMVDAMLPQADLLDEATRISKIFAAHSARHDRESSFPTEGMEELLKSPVNTALLDGSNWHTFCLLVGILSKGDASAGTAWLMHQGAGAGYSTFADKSLVSFFEAEWRRGAWFGNALSEPASGNLFHIPQQQAEKADGGFRFSGTKRFVTNCERSDYFLTSAVCDGVPSFFIIDRDDSMVIEEVWDAMGMRATRSQVVRMNGTFLPEARRVVVGPQIPNPIPLGLPWISIGVAEATLEFAIGYAKERKLPPTNVPLSHLQWVQFAVADMSVQLDAVKALALSAADATDAGDKAAGLLQLKAKLAANVAACDIATMALRIAGGSGYLKNQPLERYVRDAMSGQLMAWSTEVLRDFLGKAILEVGPG